ncbi:MULTISPECIES: pyridoxamine 5'-phosphate oxidase family protein [unclassified Caulobacter]|uniref:pyridoxamine 5'-phosphate oxidase family protein n=1 Tax=unclassified Caulobacter TaxID=2648921 RepID=UPI0006F1CD77|nr:MULTISPECIES: pyridoxamine 5'-phosphate oxidase family protein [unclassified Caulobacter]KQV56516.1 pyridoxamine 5'-phosphate oxidase [Caulobacter sp. Root342]KQV72151.1 pyridoxamine 5'-phosphate oxidase [Caulobacter sp. Root343]
MHEITTLEALEALYQPVPVAASTVKVTDHITPHYAALIQASPFVALATVGPEGLDCSPRGDLPGFVRVTDPRTLMLPDRRGNNRTDSLRNIVRDPRVALLFLIPGSGTTFRVNGRAVLSADPTLLDSFAVDGKPPRTVTVVTVEEAYFQCARAIVRSGLWKVESQVDPKALPTAGAMLAAVTAGEVGGETYDQTWPERAAKTLW